MFWSAKFIERNFLKLQAPMSLKCLFKRLPFQMCVSGVKAPLLLNVSHVVLVLPISAKLLACSQFEHLVVPYFFGLALIFCLFFQGGEGRENPTSN